MTTLKERTLFGIHVSHSIENARCRRRLQLLLVRRASDRYLWDGLSAVNSTTATRRDLRRLREQTRKPGHGNTEALWGSDTAKFAPICNENQSAIDAKRCPIHRLRVTFNVHSTPISGSGHCR